MCRTIAGLIECVSHTCPHFAACRVLLMGRIISLGKCPGVFPIGARDILRRIFSKVLLSITRLEASRACGID